MNPKPLVEDSSDPLKSLALDKVSDGVILFREGRIEFVNKVGYFSPATFFKQFVYSLYISI